MPRRLRLCPAGIPQHIVQRGNNRQACFASDEDIAAYANWLYEAALKYEVLIHAWVFMTNHVHLLVTPQVDLASSLMMQYIGRHYVRYFNYRYHRTGTLWEGRYHSNLVQQEFYLLACQRYIELNPVRANIVTAPADYMWSSYRSNALGLRSKLLTPHPVYLGLGNTKASRLLNYCALFGSSIDKELLLDIR
jgi:putative transposase